MDNSDIFLDKIIHKLQGKKSEDFKHPKKDKLSPSSSSSSLNSKSKSKATKSKGKNSPEKIFHEEEIEKDSSKLIPGEDLFLKSGLN